MDDRMSTTQLDNLLKNCSFSKPEFIGTFPADLMPSLPIHRPISLIWNTASSESPGEHWVACRITRDGIVHYFDTSGSPPNDMIHKHLEKMGLKTKIVLKRPIQPLISDLCGQYCSFYLINTAAGYPDKEILGFFSFKNHTKNDEYVKKWFETHQSLCHKI